MWEKDEPELKNATLLNDYGFYIPNHQDITTNDITTISNIINQYG